MDLADQIDDYICTIDGVGDLTMDTLAMVLFGWAVVALFLVWLAKFLYGKYAAKKKAAAGGVTGGASATELKSMKSSVLGTSATTDDLLNRNGRDLSKDRVSDLRKDDLTLYFDLWSRFERIITSGTNFGRLSVCVGEEIHPLVRIALSIYIYIQDQSLNRLRSLVSCSRSFDK